MPTKRINQLLIDLPFEHKLVGAGSILMMISLLLPWYQDIDAFKTGDMFLGLTGPLYFAGFTLLAMAIVNLAYIVTNALEIRLPFNFKASPFFVFSGIASFYLLILVNSVYFNAKFGVNITLKESQFGMFISFIASSLLTVGGYFAIRDRKAFIKEFQEKAQEPLIKIDDKVELRRPRENLRTLGNQQANQTPAAAQVSLESIEAEIKASQSMVRKQSPSVAAIRKPMVPVSTVNNEENAIPRKEPQAYRMDL